MTDLMMPSLEELDPESPQLEEAPLYGDVAALLAGGIPPPPEPVLLRRDDGRSIFYKAKVNVLFGDPECGKTWIALAAIVEALGRGIKSVFIDLDHNGMAEVVTRLLLLGATPAQLSDQALFRYAEPEDEEQLIRVVQDMRTWLPGVAVVDSLGELMPILGLSSNSPDDYTTANRRVLTPMATAGAVVIGIDHLPKDDSAREKGQTGTAAKKRTINGVSLRVTVHEQFTPGLGGSASMSIAKDRPGGLRAVCPANSKNPPAGRFVMIAYPDGTASWRVTQPKSTDEAPDAVSAADLAELDGLDPPPKSKRDVQDRCKWGSDRAQKAITRWRELQGGSRD